MRPPWGSTAPRGIRRFVAAITALTCLLALSATARATTITGIADENLGQWSGAGMAAFDATGVKQVRHTVPWNVADGAHNGELSTTTDWIKDAEAKNLDILISFRLNWGENVSPPSSVKYLEDVYKFRQSFPEIQRYTAWNEPNHKYSFLPNANTDNNPTLAGQYWVTLNSVCHSTNFASNCEVIGGDFLEPSLESAESFKSYVNQYKAQIAAAGSARPPAWALHPYTAAETNEWYVFNETFKPLTESKPIWFTEVGGMVCKNGSGYTAGNLVASEEFQASSAEHLVNHVDSKVARTYYYALAQANDGEVSCPSGTGGFDSTLLAANSRPRAAYSIVFPGALKQPVPQTTGATNVGSTQVTLNGTVDPRGFKTNYWFEWGTSVPWGHSTPLEYGGFAPGAVAHSATISGLQPGSTYHYRIVASGYGGSVYEGDQTFTTFHSSSPVLAHEGANWWVYFQGSDGHLRDWFYNGSAWSEWNIGGQMAPGTDPAVFHEGANWWVFYRGSDGALWEWFYNGSWSNSRIGGQIMEGASPVVHHEGANWWVYFQGSDGHLRDWFYNGSAWSEWNIGGQMAPGTDPAVFHEGANWWVFYRGSDGALWEWFYNGSWSNSRIGGQIMEGASPVVHHEGANWWVYFQGSDGHLRDWFYNGSAWSEWNIGGQMAPGTDPAVFHEGANWWVFYRGSDGALWEWFYNGSWSNSRIGGQIMEGASPVVHHEGANWWVYFQGSDGHLRDWFYNGSAWSEWNIGGQMWH